MRDGYQPSGEYAIPRFYLRQGLSLKLWA